MTHSISEKLSLGLPLMQFQEEGVRAIVKRFHGKALLADEMGLGKTAQALAVAAAYNAWPAVVVCPASLRLNWAKEALMWLPNHLQPIDICVVRTGRDKIYGKLAIFSYELAAQRSLDINFFSPKMMILDEAHNIKNPKALRTKRLIPICKQTPRCLLLSGTPILNRPIELWSQLEALDRSFGTYWEFARRYCDLKKGRFGWEAAGAINLPELNQRLRESCMVRRRKREVLKDLPDKRRVKIMVEGLGRNAEIVSLTNECRDALIKNRGDLQAARDMLRRERIRLSGIIFKAYTAVGALKVDHACEWIVNNSSTDSPLVVFAHHTAFLDKVSAELEAQKIKYMRIDGSTSLDNRQRGVDRFQKGELQVAVLSITAASTGLTLTRSSDMLIAELPFGPGLAAQAEDRIHRVGQKNSAVIRYLIAEGTLDEALWGLINKKSHIAHSALDGSARSSFGADTVTQGDYWVAVENILAELHSQIYGQQVKLFEGSEQSQAI